MACPLNFQVIVSGRSPKLIVHAACKYSPTFAGFSPNENGKMLGGTGMSLYIREIIENFTEYNKDIENKTNLPSTSYEKILSTVYYQSRRVVIDSCFVFSNACIVSSVVVCHRSYTKNSTFFSYLKYSYSRSGFNGFIVEKPL